MTANTKTSHLAAVAGVGTGVEAVFLDLFLQRFPGGYANIRSTAFRAGANQDMASIGTDADLGRGGSKFLFSIFRHTLSYLVDSAGLALQLLQFAGHLRQFAQKSQKHQVIGEIFQSEIMSFAVFLVHGQVAVAGPYKGDGFPRQQ